MPSIAENIAVAAQVLQESEISQPRREAASLLAFALGRDQTFLVAHSEYELSAEEKKRFSEFVQRRAAREPFQYITGRQEFYGLEFTVSPDVLIPRPETELLVETAIEILRGKPESLFCEIGIGSGCIFVSILNEIKTAQAVGLDISAKALKIAGQNVAKHQVNDRIELKMSDVYEVLKDEKFDLIVSNPPYVPLSEMESLQAEVRDYEPLNALTDNRDGLSILEKIINDAPHFLKSGGFLLLEIGFGQAEKVRAIFLPDIWQAIEILPDLQGIPRTVKARLK